MRMNSKNVAYNAACMEKQAAAYKSSGWELGMKFNIESSLDSHHGLWSLGCPTPLQKPLHSVSKSPVTHSPESCTKHCRIRR